MVLARLITQAHYHKLKLCNFQNHLIKSTNEGWMTFEPTEREAL